MTDHLDPEFLKALTEVEKKFLEPNELASDGRDVIAGVPAPPGADDGHR